VITEAKEKPRVAGLHLQASSNPLGTRKRNSMKIKLKYAMLIISSCGIMFGISSCKQSTSPNDKEKYLSPPSQKTSADEIKSIEGINTIHIVEVFTTYYNGDTINRYQEYYIDTTRIKIMSYTNRDSIQLIEVSDRKNGCLWIYQFGQLSHPQTTSDYDIYVQGLLGSWLNEPIETIGQTVLDGKSCEIITDSTNLKEWIWADHRMPIQRYSYANNRGFMYKKIQMEFNQVFPDSLFTAPSDGFYSAP
jgi:hypothetical protein